METTRRGTPDQFAGVSESFDIPYPPLEVQDLYLLAFQLWKSGNYTQPADDASSSPEEEIRCHNVWM